ncbi:MAG TPA: type II toxin-antitoxin system RelE/ParE family toxin [Methylomirabilota bacterium]|nr:type II toxin-antitoxin system RelE/ParE family toxin [Methylomirabilota bacterium]
MTPFQVQLTRAAVRDLDALPPADRDRITGDVVALAENAIGRPPRIRRLRGLAFPVYRLRSGDHRVLYRVDGPVVTVMRVVDRRDLDRAIRSLGLVRPERGERPR